MEEKTILTKTSEVKVLRDPIHGYIRVEYQVIWECINSSWFQRLRRIRQLGGAFMVYHTADHTRFGHSLGVYEIVRRMVHEIPDLSNYLTDEEKIIVMLAGLLHDVGHGPFSHAFEAISPIKHETYSCAIIEQEDSEIYRILESYKKGLAKKVADVIRHEYEKPLLSQIISSQLDADRMDYLLRDAYFTGTKYGEFDLERVLRVIRVQDGLMVIKKSGVYAIENYIMARYHMYWQVYYHPVARSYEAMLELIFRRMKDLYDEGKLPKEVSFFEPIFHDQMMPLEQYKMLDESTCIFGFHMLETCEDEILRDLSTRLLNRDLFESIDSNEKNAEMIETIIEQLKEKHLNTRYYLGRDQVMQKPYPPYKEGKNNRNKAIFVRVGDEKCEELSNVSAIVKVLAEADYEKEESLFYPGD